MDQRLQSGWKMPYIKTERRLAIDDGAIPKNAGELNYALTKIAHKYLVTGTKINYQRFNDIVGALESCKLEIYRRLVAEYENKKIIENGDVFGD